MTNGFTVYTNEQNVPEQLSLNVRQQPFLHSGTVSARRMKAERLHKVIE